MFSDYELLLYLLYKKKIIIYFNFQHWTFIDKKKKEYL